MLREAPVPLITFEKDKYVIGSDALDVISKIKGPIGVVAVAGLYRTGKSYLLNRLLDRQEGFEIGPTVNACTKGIYMWGKPLQVQRGNSTLSLIFIDTEGLGSIDASATHDARIFSLACLLSSLLIYNSMGTIDETALDRLSLVTHLTSHIHARARPGQRGAKGGRGAEAERPEELAPFLPAFVWVLRDFALQLRDEHGAEITEREYLERALRDVPGTSERAQSKNAVRRAIRGFFPERDCVVLVRPVNDERLLQSVGCVPWRELREEFRRKVSELRARVLQRTPAKTLEGVQLNGAAFAALVQSYVETLNRGAVPVIADTWASLVQLAGARALDHAMAEYAAAARRELPADRPLDDAELQAALARLDDIALAAFRAEALGDATEHLRKLEARLKQERSAAQHRNAQLTSYVCRERLRDVPRALEQRLQKGEITRVDDLVAQWDQALRQFLAATPGAAREQLTALLDVQAQHLPRLLAALVAHALAPKEQELQRLAARLDETSAQIRAAQEERLHLHSDLQAARLEAERAAAQARDLRRDLDQLRADHARVQGERERDSAEARTAAREREQLRAEVEAERRRVRELEAAVKEREARFDQLQREMQSRLADLGQNMQASEAAMRALREEAARSVEEERRALEAQREENERLKRELAATRAGLEEERRALQERLHLLQDENDRLRRPACAAPPASADLHAGANGNEEDAEVEGSEAKGGKKHGRRRKRLEEAEDTTPRQRVAKKPCADEAEPAPPSDEIPPQVTAMTIAQLKNLLLKNGVKLPVVQAKKSTYLDLYRQNASRIKL